MSQQKATLPGQLDTGDNLKDWKLLSYASQGTKGKGNKFSGVFNDGYDTPDGGPLTTTRESTPISSQQPSRQSSYGLPSRTSSSASDTSYGSASFFNLGRGGYKRKRKGNSMKKMKSRRSRRSRRRRRSRRSRRKN
jgi:hypothetical protein